jgi:hypothetical protein
MKNLWIAVSTLLLLLAPAFSANISSAGVDGPDGGLLKVDQADPYWWFCVQPDGSEGPISAGPVGYEADVVSLEYGWTRQTTERFTFAGATTPAAQADLALQINVIEYVLDTYLPWNETTNNFLENVADPASSTDQDADDNFFNRFYAVQQYVKRLHGKLYEDNTSFTDLSLFSPSSDFQNLTAADVARNNFFNTIKADINNKDAANFFISYDPAHNYAIVNTFKADADPLDYQDAIIIGAVPEPSAALLGLGSLLLLGTRRRTS